MPDGNGGKKIEYYTSTHENMRTEMGFYQDPYTQAEFDESHITCESNFGPNRCNGISGVFGSTFKSATHASDGLWTLWLWLPEESHSSVFDYNLQSGDEVAVWIGTYVGAADFVTSFDTGYWQYGEMIVLENANLLSLGSWLACLYIV